MDLGNKRVTVMGLGRFGGGVGVARFLAEQGAAVTVTDVAGADALASSLRKLDDLDLTYRLGGHVESDFISADLVVHSPAVPPDNPYLRSAQKAGVPITSEMELFFELCPGRIIGITGTAGKSTTTAMLSAVLEKNAGTGVWCGGNIGRSLLGQCRRIGPDDLVVLELSSFQLENLGRIGRSPELALVTNIFANHLDRHGTMAAYAAAKANIVRFQRGGQHAWLPAGEPFYGWRNLGAGQKHFVDWEAAASPFELRVPGAHNQANARAAWTLGRHLGLADQTIRATLAEFVGLDHRLQFAARVGGVQYINDSKSTTPQAVVQALRAFEQPLVVIAGGYDKQVDLRGMSRELAARAKAVVCLGQTGPAIQEQVRAFRADNANPAAVLVDGLDEAVATAAGLASPGDVVLLSPGCASLDMFRNYEQRGEAFVRLAENLSRPR